MGRQLPGYNIALLDAEGEHCKKGEICLDLSARPLGLMQGYLDDRPSSMRVGVNGYYHTGDVASCDPDGYIFCAGHKDELFKSSDYRLSPF
jgi:acetyl-CoA synthetase